MTRSSIKTTLTTGVTLDTPGYGSPLDLTNTGAVMPAALGQTGIYGTMSGDRVNNNGTLTGGAGSHASGVGGGTGVDLTSSGTLFNTAAINGGIGGTYADYTTGGNAVDLGGGGRLVNAGAITGGGGATGGAGADLAGPGRVVNSGSIYGGAATGGGDGASGVGLLLEAGGRVSNSGIISGGFSNPGGPGGVGVDLVAGGLLSNTGKIFGGFSYHDAPGAAVSAAGAFLSNSGTVQGGRGGYDNPNQAGSAIALDGGGLVNSGLVEGGDGARAESTALSNGGEGVDLIAGRAVNAGTITGGAGGSSFYYTPAGSGGAGVYLGSGAIFNNKALIEGGNAGTGVLSGGTGLSAGAGVVIDGGTLTTSGKIEGGIEGVAGKPHKLTNAPSVEIRGDGGTLIVEPNAVFVGGIVADGNADDKLILAGTAAGTIAGFGATVSGFTNIDVLSGSKWTFNGTNTLSASETLAVHGTLATVGTTTASGPVLIAGTLDVAKGRLAIDGVASGAGSLVVTSGATLLVGGTLSAGLGHLVLSGTKDTLSMASTTSDQATLSGFGIGDKIDLTNIALTSTTTASFAGGVLTIQDGASQLGSLHLAGDYTSSNFTLTPDGSAGLTIGYVPSATAPDFASSALSTGPHSDVSPPALATIRTPPDSFDHAVIWFPHMVHLG